MPEITRRATFYARKSGAPKMFHLEVDGAVVNITVGLRDDEGRQVTRVDVLPDDERRGGDGFGYVWHQDGPRIIRQHPKEN